MANLAIRVATVTEVYPTGMYEVEFEDTGEVSSSVTQVFPYYNDSTGAMVGSIPEVGSVVLCVRTPPQDAWEILAFKSTPRISDPLAGDDETDHDRFDYLGDRPELAPGDTALSGTRRNKVLVSRDGNVEVSATQFARTDWLINEQRVRTIAMTAETTGLFGSAEWFSDIQHDLDAQNSVPTGYREAISRSSGSPPIYYEFKGSVPKDGSLDTTTQDSIPSQEGSRVCYVKRIVPEETASKLHVAAKDVTDQASSYVKKQDDRGNVLESAAGDRYFFSRADSLNITRDHSISAGGRIEQHSVEGSAYTTRGHLDLRGDKSVTISTEGKLVLDADEVVLGGKDSRTDKVQGSYEVDAESNIRLKAGSNISATSGQGVSLAAGKDLSLSAKGTINVEANNSNPANIGQDTPSHKTNVYGGKHYTNVAEGSYEVTVGPEQAPIARIKIHNSPMMPQNIGTIEIVFTATNSGFKIKPDGSWELGGMQGAIKADTTGKITLGPSVAPVGGNIVTTLSHPVDYMTGAPILGHAMATVAAGPVMPGPGPSSLGIVPPIINPPNIPAK